MGKEDKKVPFVGTNATDLTLTAGLSVTLITPPAGKTAFLTRVMVTNMGAAAAADNLQLFDEVATNPGTPAATLIPDIRVPYQSTVIVDLGDEGVPVTTAISVTSTTAANALLAYDVAVSGYYL